MTKFSNYGCITLLQRPELFTSFIKKQSNYTNICIVLLRFVNILKIWFQYKLCYCLIILVLHWKILISDCLLFKKRRLPAAPTKVGFDIFPWNFVHVVCVAMPKNFCADFFVLFLFCILRSTNSDKIQFSWHYFAGISKKKACVKVGTLRNFDLFRQQT